MGIKALMFAVFRRGGHYWSLFFGVLLCALVFGCGRQENTQGKTVVRFSFWGDYKDLAMWKTIAANFEKANPDIKMKLEYISGDYGRKLPLVMASGTAADVVEMDDEVYPSYAVRGYLLNLKPYVQRDRAELKIDDFFPTSLESFTYRGFQGGLPWDGGPVLVYYNKDMFDKAHIPYPTNNWTWAQFRAIAKKLTHIDKEGDGANDRFGTNISVDGMLGVEPVVWSFGGRVLNPEHTKFVMNSPKALQAFQFMYDLKWQDHSVAWAGEGESIMTEDQLLRGGVGMVLGGTYMMANLEAFKGKNVMRWGITEVPRGPYGDQYTRVTWDGISINAKTPYKEQSWRFIKFLLNEQSQALVGRMGRSLPVRRADALKYFMQGWKNVNVHEVLKAADHGRMTPITPKYLEISQAMQPFMDKMNLGMIKPKAALDAMAPKVDAVLAKELAKWGRKKKTP